MIALHSEIHTKHINTLCGQNVKFFSIKPGGKFRMNRPVKTKSGMLLTTQEEQLKRWKEHFSKYLTKVITA